jgi:hypothetical protein
VCLVGVVEISGHRVDLTLDELAHGGDNGVRKMGRHRSLGILQWI